MPTGSSCAPTTAFSSSGDERRARPRWSASAEPRHGVGLEIHEPPLLGRGSQDVLVSGDVVTIEPGCYRKGFGGCRLEDLVLVTDDGREVLTDYAYDLEP